MGANLTGPRRRPGHGRSSTPAARDGRAAGGSAAAASAPEKRPTVGLERSVQLATAIVAPTTLLTALLFYFGWIRTNALFQYFGVEATALGFSTQDYLLRSGEALYAPLGALLVLGLVGWWAHGLVAAWLAARRRPETLRAAAGVLVVIGLVLFARGVAGVLVPRLSASDSLASPLCLGLGTALGAYGRWLWLRQRELQGSKATTPQSGWAGMVNVVLVVLLMILSLFWATTDYARAYGQGRAAAYARDLAVRPGVIVYSAERLFLSGPGVLESALPAEQHGSYRYRYGGLRLLTESDGRLFLLPVGWTTRQGSAIVLSASDKVRVEFVRGVAA